MKRSEFADQVSAAKDAVDALFDSFDQLNIKPRPVNGEIVAYMGTAAEALNCALNSLEDLDNTINGESF